MVQTYHNNILRERKIHVYLYRWNIKDYYKSSILVKKKLNKVEII